MRLMLVLFSQKAESFGCFCSDWTQILSSAFLQGADADDLNRVYEAESKLLEPWTDSPSEISTDDWRDYLGCRE